MTGMPRLTTPDRDPEEDNLVLLAARGDRAAFGELYQRYARTIHAILLARVPAAEADDLVQDVFISALRHLASLRTPGAFPAWLASIARNRANDFHRAARPAVELDEALPAAPDRRQALAILDVINQLPDTYRETLLMRLVEGMTGPEISARTGLTHSSVRVNLCRGMKLLREKLSGSNSL
jgi:RNA polymerase sigma-70 factor, ECF subfamily